MAHAIFCLAHDEDHASRMVEELKNAGFPSADISVLMPDKSSTRSFAREKQTKSPEGAVTGAVAGGALGGIFGWLTGIGALAIPGIGPVVAAGPIMSALSGFVMGGVTGGLVGALAGMGIPEREAKHFETRLREGKVLVSVGSDNPEEARRARNILERAGGEDISTSGEPERDEEAERVYQRLPSGREPLPPREY
jgi:hypothetical protein